MSYPDALSIPDGSTPDGSSADAVSGDVYPDTGAAPMLDPVFLYTEMCADCHGPAGEGGLGPALVNWSDAQELALRIDNTMPASNPDECAAECAVVLADYIIANFSTAPPAPACDGTDAIYPEQRARLLNSREYAQTVRDLFWPTVACTIDTDCDVAVESCLEDVCTADPCGTVSFTFNPGADGYSSVHVAGSFNNWAPTVAEGGWPMSWDATAGVWRIKQELPPGEYLYKFVADNNWLHDTANPNFVTNEFGSYDSVLTIDCSGANPDAALEIASLVLFPPVGRPEGFAFDTHAGSGLVTTVHVDAELAASSEIVALAAGNLDRHLPCDPTSNGVAQCADEFVRDFGRRAFRRPLTDAQAARYAALVTGAADFTEGALLAMETMLVSPLFFYRVEVGEAQADGTFALDGWELASALSYALWGTMPDEALFAAAEAGALNTVEGILAEAYRLLADPRAADMVSLFGEQWLGGDKMATLTKKASEFPDFELLREAMRQETRRFVRHVVFDGTGTFSELLTADYTFASPALAAHYGLGAPDADGKVTYSDGRRSGVLGHGAVLATTAHSDQTSPIRRGLFVRSNILCQELPPPPPDAGGVPDIDPDATTRERFKQHTANPTCYACHQYIDDLGFGFEHFDPVGAWRDTENGKPIDASGDMNDIAGLGTDTSAPYEGLPELATLLAAEPGARDCFATQVYRFAMGRKADEADHCHLEELHTRFAASGGDIKQLILEVVTSDAFRIRQSPSAPGGQP